MTDAQERRELHRAGLEIEFFSLVIVAEEIVDGRLTLCDVDWALSWLVPLRLGSNGSVKVREQVDLYQQLGPDKRRLHFASALERVLPEAIKAPLVIYRLFPLAVQVATAVAFHDPLRACEIRNKQIAILPAIDDCQACHGRPLDNGEICNECGNPLWKISWLCVAD
jgi:hypothetical protein